ncbi:MULTISPECIES: enoyl-CoA hydratase-related protein [unclassified Frankia]|uniref:enoyl-CoA hydratase-related protein n=1 Tax=unclassified Frankia TaxID=2632575 RepID=UPI002AD27090|nr:MULTISPECIES: enoyl-CoA hydratase-related protein [unclassified Frankia]
MTSAQDPLLATKDAGVLTVTMNRSPQRNALSPGLVSAFADALADLAHDDSLGACVVTGAGSAFCAGLDFAAYAEANADRTTVTALLHSIGQTPKPIIAAVNGPAVTGGLELALACDWIIAAENAVFFDTHARVGAYPGGGLPAYLVEAVGLRTAKAMTLGGLRLDAVAALRAGLVAEITSPAELLNRSTEVARTICMHDARLVGMLRRGMNEAVGRTTDHTLRAGKEHLNTWRASADTTLQRSR